MPLRPLRARWRRRAAISQGPERDAMISIVIPARNEAENVQQLFDEICVSMSSTHPAYEVIFVDDHSEDGTPRILRSMSEVDMRIRVLSLAPMQEGKDAALMMGMSAARGSVIVTMDGDLQNLPTDIPALLAYMRTNDMACGIRTRRFDPQVKRIISYLANWARTAITGDTTRDAGCALRAMRAECVGTLRRYNAGLFGCAHYFHPHLLRLHGYRVVQLPVAHRPRTRGRSKFATVRGRTLSGLRACLAIRRLQVDAGRVCIL